MIPRVTTRVFKKAQNTVLADDTGLNNPSDVVQQSAPAISDSDIISADSAVGSRVTDSALISADSAVAGSVPNRPAGIPSDLLPPKRLVPVPQKKTSLLFLSREEMIALISEREARREQLALERDVKTEKKRPDTEIYAVGKRKTYVDAAIFGSASVDAYLDKNIPEKNIRFIGGDPVRGRTGRYWALYKNQLAYVDNVSIPTETRVPHYFTFHSPNNLDTPSDFGKTVQWVDLTANRNRFTNANGRYSKSLWYTYIKGGVYDGSTLKGTRPEGELDGLVKEGVEYFDHVFDMPTPFSKKEIEKYSSIHGAMSYEITPEYNFYIEKYENRIVKDIEVRENTLPNMYVMLSELTSEHPHPEFRNHITLDDTFKTQKKLLENKTRKEQKFDFKEHPIGQYYDIYGLQYTNAVLNGSVERLDSKFSNLAVSINDISLFDKYNRKDEMFPMNVGLKFQTDRTTTFAQLLKETGLMDEFVTRIINKNITNGADSLNTRDVIETIIQTGDNNSNLKRNSELQGGVKRIYDVAEMLNSLQNNEVVLDDENAVYLGEYNNQIKANSGSEYSFAKQLLLIIFRAKLQTLIQQKLRTFEEVMNGKTAYSETVMYRIAKYLGDGSGEPIQNFYLPNSNEIDVLEYIDTQVKYDRRYTYKVYAYNLVIGSKYVYSDLTVDDFDHHALYKVIHEPSLKIVETEYFSKTTKVVDSPPIMPQIDLIPYKGIDNKVLITLQSNVGRYNMQPINILASDEENFAKVRESQEKGPNDEIMFEADDHVSVFQVFRSEKQPTGYSDLRESLRATVFTDVSPLTDQKATSAAFVDNIEPNKKYYYMFRAVDNHGHVSNPTEMYEIEMINESGTIFMLKKVVDFAEKPIATSKEARRYIQLVPTVDQAIINTQKSGYDEAETAEDIKSRVRLGVADDSVWGKRFKIRLTSKSTGKKFDFYFDFTHRPAEKV